MNLELLLESAGIWRGGEVSPLHMNSVSTGFAALDELLPGGGLPRGALTEILTPGEGVGALSLIMPALAGLSRGDKWLAWIAPPHIPYAPALAGLGVDVSRILLVHDRRDRDNLWALEQALRSGACGAVIGWLGEVQQALLRRLQLAAEAGDALGLLFRPQRFAAEPSPAALRLVVKPAAPGIRVRALKCRGGWPAGDCMLELHGTRNPSSEAACGAPDRERPPPAGWGGAGTSPA